MQREEKEEVRVPVFTRSDDVVNRETCFTGHFSFRTGVAAKPSSFAV